MRNAVRLDKQSLLVCSLVSAVSLSALAAEYDVSKGATQTITASAAGDSIVKKGEGKLYIDGGTALGSVTGAITVENGTLGANDPNNFGKPTSITVADGATLDLSAQSGNNAGYLKNNVVLSGYGYENQGAIRRTSGSAQDNLLGGFTLGADTLIYNTVRCGASGTIDFAGHYLEKQGPGGELLLNGCTYKNLGGIILDGGNNGQLTLQGTGSSFGGDSNTLFIGKSGILCLWVTPDLGKAPPWKMVVTNGLWLSTGATSQNCNGWDGPVEIASGKTLTVSPQKAESIIKIGGAISNNGKLEKRSSGKLFVCGDYGGGSINVYDGDLIFTGAGKKREVCAPTLANVNGPSRIAYENAGYVHHASGNVWLASNVNASPAVMSVSNTVHDGWYSSTHANTIALGNDSPYGGLLTVDAGSSVSNRMHIGRHGFGGVFQRGGDVFWQVKESVRYDWFAEDGYGFYGMDAGTLLIDNWFRTAYAANTARSFLVQRGGTITVQGSVQLAARGRAEMYVANGTTTLASDLTLGYNGNYEGAGGGATLTVAKGGVLDLDRKGGVHFQHKDGFDAVVNLNDGGTLKAKRMNAGTVGGLGVYYNFNGGKLCPTQAWGFTDQWDSSGNDPAQATVYDGGVLIDPSRCVADNDWSRIPFGFKKATGMGVQSIELPAADSDYWKCNFFGPTRVIISGKGHAATALVDFDLWTKKPRGVIVTGQGFGYDEDTTAVVESWDGKTTYPCRVTMFTHKGTGGLTATGGYGVTLAGANTYGGPTRVEGGSTLIMGAASAFPAGSPIELRPGASTHSTLDLASKTNPTVPSVTGAGSVINGAVTVTDEIAFYVADAKAGKFLNFSNLLTLGSNVKVRVMDPENLDDSIKSLTVVSANGGLAAPQTLPLVDLPAGEWGVSIRGNKVVFLRHRGLSVLVR